MTEAADTPDEAPEGPSPLALVSAMALVTRYRLRLTHSGDARLGSLGPDYEVGAAMWTGKRAAFVGFFQPAAADPLGDVQRRISEAAEWGASRVAAQPAERCDILLVALSPVSGTPASPPMDQRVHIGVIAVDVAAGEAVELLGGTSNLPGVREFRGYARAVRDGAPTPTLAAVDLAERETVRGGYVQPARSALNQTPYVTYALIGTWVGIWLLEHLVVRTTTVGAYHYYTTSVHEADFGVFEGSSSEWWRYIASGFLHLFDTPVHVALNSASMYFIGRFIEQMYGRIVLLATFVICTVAGCAMVVLLSDAGIYQFYGGVVGASSGICGFIGLLLVLGRVQGKNIPAGMAAGIRSQAGGNTIFILAYGFLIPGIAWPGHVGGFLAGAALGLVVPPLSGLGGRDLTVYERAALYAVIAIGAVALGFAAWNVVQAMTAH